MCLFMLVLILAWFTAATGGIGFAPGVIILLCYLAYRAGRKRK